MWRVSRRQRLEADAIDDRAAPFDQCSEGNPCATEPDAVEEQCDAEARATATARSTHADPFASPDAARADPRQRVGRKPSPASLD